MQFYINPKSLPLRHHKSKPAWNEYKSDLGKYRASEKELQERKQSRSSKNCHKAILVYRKKLQEMRHNLIPYIREYQEKYKPNPGHPKPISQFVETKFSKQSGQNNIVEPERYLQMPQLEQDQFQNLRTGAKSLDDMKETDFVPTDESSSDEEISLCKNKPVTYENKRTMIKLHTSRPQLPNFALDSSDMTLSQNSEIHRDHCPVTSKVSPSSKDSSCKHDLRSDSLFVEADEAIMYLKDEMLSLEESLAKNSIGNMFDSSIFLHKKSNSDEGSQNNKNETKLCNTRPRWLGEVDLNPADIREIKKANPTLLSSSQSTKLCDSRTAFNKDNGLEDRSDRPVKSDLYEEPVYIENEAQVYIDNKASVYIDNEEAMYIGNEEDSKGGNFERQVDSNMSEDEGLTDKIFSTYNCQFVNSLLKEDFTPLNNLLQKQSEQLIKEFDQIRLI